MTGASWWLLGVFAVLAATDWFAVERERKPLEYVAKPATLAALVGVAATLDPADGAQRAWFVAALVLSLAGDVFLMLPSDQFVPGLGSFLLGHVAYVVGFAAVAGGGWVALIPLVLLAGAPLSRRIVAGARAHDARLTGPVAAYIVVITTMVAAALGSARPIAIAGALLFYASDAMIGWSRFASAFPHARLAIIVTYHVGQLLLVASLV